MNGEQKTLFKKLNDRQKSFALNRLKGMTLSASYKASGYAAKGDDAMRANASEILSNRNMKAFIESMQVEIVKKTIMNREEMAEKLSTLSRSNIFDLLYVSENEYSESVIEIKSKEQLSIDQQVMVKSIKAGKFGLELVLHDKLAAMKQLSDMQGYNAPKKQEISGKLEITDLTSDQKKMLNGKFNDEY